MTGGGEDRIRGAVRDAQPAAPGRQAGDNRRTRWSAPNPGYIAEPLKTESPPSFIGQPIPERQWVVPGWIPDGVVTMVNGDGGLGKSLLLQQLATAAATGNTWLNLPVKRCRTLIVACEDDVPELRRRQDRINAALGLELEDLDDLAWCSRVGLDNLLVTAGRYEDRLEATDFFYQLERTINDYEPGLVILDSLHDLFGGRENDRGHARQFINMLAGWCHELAIVLAAHPSLYGLQSGSGLSGSTAWSNSVRSRLYLKRLLEEMDPDLRMLQRLKANYASTGDEIQLKWIDGCFHNTAAQGALAGIVRRTCERVFLDLLRKMNTEGRHVTDNAYSANYAPKAFAGRADREGFSYAEFKRAMETLFTANRIKMGSYGDRPSRMRPCIVEVEEGPES